MRSSYIVSYDITSPRRLQKVHKAMTGFGQHLQYSVFRCDLSDVDKVRMKAKLSGLINHKEECVGQIKALLDLPAEFNTTYLLHVRRTNKGTP